jgi:hypothetical protein
VNRRKHRRRVASKNGHRQAHVSLGFRSFACHALTVCAREERCSPCLEVDAFLLSLLVSPLPRGSAGILPNAFSPLPSFFRPSPFSLSGQSHSLDLNLSFWADPLCFCRMVAVQRTNKLSQAVEAKTEVVPSKEQEFLVPNFTVKQLLDAIP